MGKWIYQRQLDHVCKPPTMTPGACYGDIWQCDCKKTWKVTKVNFDQRDGDWLSFVEYCGEIPKQKIIGTK